MSDLKVPWDEIGEKLGLVPVEEEEDEGKTHDVKLQFKDSELMGVTGSGSVQLDRDLVVRPQTKYLEDDLALYASPGDILRVYNERPDLLRQKKKSGCDGDCETCTSHSGTSCGSKKK